MTQCTQAGFGFEGHFGREVVARFDSGQITSDAGALLVRKTEQRTGILRQFTSCFTDHRRSGKVEHTLPELLRQRVYGLVLGYEDLNDHDQLRADPLLAVLAGKRDVDGSERRRKRNQGKPGAGKSTLNRLELTPKEANHTARYKKIVMDENAVDRLLVDLYIQAQEKMPEQVVLDLDATDDPVHGEQEGPFFTAITVRVVICRCTCLPANTCCARGCGLPTWTLRPARWKRWNGWWGSCGRCGRR